MNHFTMILFPFPHLFSLKLTKNMDFIEEEKKLLICNYNVKVNLASALQMTFLPAGYFILFFFFFPLLVDNGER